MQNALLHDMCASAAFFSLIGRQRSALLGSCTTSQQHICFAGQAVVQISRSKYASISNKELWAIKLFADRKAFEAEAQLYTDKASPLRPFLPPVRGTSETKLSL